MHEFRPAPLLKDVAFEEDVDSEQSYFALYVQACHIMRHLFQSSHLVHADLSEFNLLYVQLKIFTLGCGLSASPHTSCLMCQIPDTCSLSTHNCAVMHPRRCLRGQLYVIDVSQAVEHDHPRALDFLREDCDHITCIPLVSSFFAFSHGIESQL